MKKQVEVLIPPDFINDKDFLYRQAADAVKEDPAAISAVIPVRRFTRIATCPSPEPRSKKTSFSVKKDRSAISKTTLAGVF